MSEPVKNADIEDVLSSIRRLVSEDHRHPVDAPDTEQMSLQDRLVLTPALRVATPEEPEDPDATDAEQAGETIDTTAADGQSATENTAAEELDRVPEADATPPVMAEEHASPEEQTPEDTSGEMEASVSAPDSAAPSDEPTGEQTPELLSDADDAATEETAFIDTLVADISGARDEPVGPTPDQAKEEDPAPWTSPGSTLYEAAGLSHSGAEDAVEDIRPLGEKIAALEEVIAKTDDQWEPDGAGFDEYAGTDGETLAWEDASAVEDETEDDTDEAEQDDPDDVPIFSHRVFEEARTSDEQVAAEAPEDAERAETDAPTGAAEEATLDEAALRQLVADIVREELQGPLGERITRSVRKLVRREIHRALSLQDLE